MLQIRQDRFAALAEGGVMAVAGGLRDALRLEFSTIPLYLYSLWSLERTKNRAIAMIIRSVVIEEMLHMTLVCNILNALGQSPVIDDPNVVPVYPGPLPAGVESDLIVHLAPFSTDQLSVFLQIEEPETALNFPALAEASAPVTIGLFYRELQKQIALLQDSDFAGSAGNQIGASFIDKATPVSSVQTAQAALGLIVTQGEGTPISPLEAPDGSPAHYYRFKQIEKRALLRKNPNAGPNTPPDQQYIYDGDPVILDPTGVSAAPRDPKAGNYAARSSARQAMDAFNTLYRELLKLLQRGFNGGPDALTDAINNSMTTLGTAGRKLMATAPADGGPLGPGFEFLP